MRDCGTIYIIIGPLIFCEAKGLFYLASRKDHAFYRSPTGAFIKTESIGVWWVSMLLHIRITYPSYIENKGWIVSKCEKFGDRLNELVIIRQHQDHG